MRHLSIALATVLGAAHAQAWSAVPFGSGCWDLAPPWNMNPTILGTSGQATPGFTLTIQYGGPTAYNAGTGPFYEYRPALVLGLSDQVAGGVPLPWTLPAALTVMPCQLLVSTDVVEFMNPINQSSYGDSLALPIPNNPLLIGFTLYAQWAVFHTVWFPGPRATTVSTSHALAITIGL